MRKSNSIEKYRELAKEKNMLFMEESAPRYVTMKVCWKCPLCGEEKTTSYVTLKHEVHPCRCRNGMQRPPEDYKWLAKMVAGAGIDIVYAHKLVPRNIKQDVQWLIDGDCSITVSYSDLQKAAFSGEIVEFINAKKSGQ